MKLKVFAVPKLIRNNFYGNLCRRANVKQNEADKQQ